MHIPVLCFGRKQASKVRFYSDSVMASHCKHCSFCLNLLQDRVYFVTKLPNITILEMFNLAEQECLKCLQRERQNFIFKFESGEKSQFFIMCKKMGCAPENVAKFDVDASLV